MKIAIGCDEAAYSLKTAIMRHLDERGIAYQDFGAEKGETVLYPDVAVKVAEAVAAGQFERGILMCGTGIGKMCIRDSRVPGRSGPGRQGGGGLNRRHQQEAG